MFDGNQKRGAQLSLGKGENLGKNIMGQGVFLDSVKYEKSDSAEVGDAFEKHLKQFVTVH